MHGKVLLQEINMKNESPTSHGSQVMSTEDDKDDDETRYNNGSPDFGMAN